MKNIEKRVKSCLLCSFWGILLLTHSRLDMQVPHLTLTGLQRTRLVPV